MGKARNLARLVVDSGGAVDASNLTNAVPADGSITSAKIADGAVGTADIADSAVTTAKIAAGAVATVDIADSAVTTAKIANSAVTIAKLSATGTPGSSNYLRGDGSWQTVSAGIAAQNCSYTGGLVEIGPMFLQTTNPQTLDLGSNRVMTGLRKAHDGCNGMYIYVRGYNIKNTA